MLPQPKTLPEPELPDDLEDLLSQPSRVSTIFTHSGPKTRSAVSDAPLFLNLSSLTITTMAGNVAATVFGRVKCDACRKLLVIEEAATDRRLHRMLRFKDRGGLLYPHLRFAGVLQRVEQRCLQVLEQVGTRAVLARTEKLLASALLPDKRIACEDHRKKVTDNLLSKSDIFLPGGCLNIICRGSVTSETESPHTVTLTLDPKVSKVSNPSGGSDLCRRHTFLFCVHRGSLTSSSSLKLKK